MRTLSARRDQSDTEPPPSPHATSRRKGKPLHPLCHPDRSEAKRRDLQCAPTVKSLSRVEVDSHCENYTVLCFGR